MHIWLGTVNPFIIRYFPKVFGEADDEPLQASAALARFKTLTDEVCLVNCLILLHVLMVWTENGQVSMHQRRLIGTHGIVPSKLGSS